MHGCGLVAASALIIARAADRAWSAFTVTVATFALIYWTRISLLLVMAAAVVLGFSGVV